MSSVLELESQRDRALAATDEILTRAESQRRDLTHIEDGLVRKHREEAQHASDELRRIEFRKELADYRKTVTVEPTIPQRLTVDYRNGFFDSFRTGGTVTAALVEGTNSAGGYAVPITVDSQIVPLAPADRAVRRLATVTPTTTDRKVAQIAGLPTASQKTEGSAFGSGTSTLGQFTLSAYTVGIEWDGSIEAFEDIPLFTATSLRDISSAVQTWEEGKFLSGSGSGEPQGILGNIDTGVAAGTPDANSNLLSIDSTFAILDTLKAEYDANASWLMQKATALEIRRAQVAANLFEPVFRRENGVDLLHGYPVNYSASMPAIAAGATPAIFGSFSDGYLIGDRGGSAIRMKVLDQTKILQGLITVLAFRRTDGRVRCPEALKALTLHT